MLGKKVYWGTVLRREKELHREVGEVRSKTLGAEWTKAFQNGGQVWERGTSRRYCSLHSELL